MTVLALIVFAWLAAVSAVLALGVACIGVLVLPIMPAAAAALFIRIGRAA
jgi:hypothetical protein